MTDPTAEELLQYLASMWIEEDRRPGEISIKDLMDATGKTRGAAREFLEGQVRIGRLTKRTTSSGHVWFKKTTQ